jgi:hypothetical protein
MLRNAETHLGNVLVDIHILPGASPKSGSPTLERRTDHSIAGVGGEYKFVEGSWGLIVRCGGSA